MEWTKSNISAAELEQKQQAYIKEALEMAKRSSSKGQDDEALKAQEKAAAEKKAEAERKAAEKAAAERKAKERAEAERKAAEKAEAEQKAKEKAEAERKAAEEKAEAERKESEKANAEKEAAEEKAEIEEAEDNADEDAESEELIDPDDFAELIGNENIEDDPEEDDSDCEEEAKDKDPCDGKDSELIDTAKLAHTKNPANSPKKENPPANFNQYINRHNDKAQCNCPSCQRKRAMMGK